MENVPASLHFQDVKSGPDLSKVVIIDSMKMRVTKIDKGWNDFELIFFYIHSIFYLRNIVYYTKKIFFLNSERANHLDRAAVPRS